MIGLLLIPALLFGGPTLVVGFFGCIYVIACLMED